MTDEQNHLGLMRGWRGIALGVVGVLIIGTFAWTAIGLAADTNSETDALPSPAPSTASPPSDPDITRAPDPALAEFYSQQLVWSSCRDDFLCASLEVPLDYEDPTGDRIQLALLKVPTEGDRIGSLVVNPGGPGASGTDYAAGASRVFRKPLLDRFDIVGFDPRGTGDSDPIDCLTDEELDAYVAADPDPDTAAEADAYVAGVTRLAQGCAAKSGALAKHVSTIEAAQDMDVLRAALGEKQLTYLGASYGTQLGATYADLFPKRVGRLVLDGAIDLSASGEDLSKQQATGFEVALRAYVSNCVEESDSCFLGDSVDEGIQRIQEFLADVEETPLTTNLDGRELEVGNAVYGLIAPLYERQAWPALSLALRSAFNGDGTTLLQFSDLYTSRGENGYNTNIIEANITIDCLDDPTHGDPARVEASYPEFEAASPTFGRIFAWGAVGCNGFPPERVVPARDIRAAGAAPILVVGTTRDPATPMRWAEALADQLESGVLLRRDGDGHTAYNSGNECIDDTIEDYLIHGKVPVDGLSC